MTIHIAEAQLLSILSDRVVSSHELKNLFRILRVRRLTRG